MAETPAAESIPPSEGVASATTVCAPRRALWRAAAVPPVPPPTTRDLGVEHGLGADLAGDRSQEDQDDDESQPVHWHLR